ncbi:MAG TPA: hypothetical protein PKD59_00425 [Miltoncostaeaceae bacterium]|nr:hypothetical protein [Miltoncostaeaceae bacterium]
MARRRPIAAPHGGTRARMWRAALIPLAGAALLLPAAQAAAATGTLRVTDVGPSLGRTIPIAIPGGGTFSTDPGVRTATLTSADGTRIVSEAWCVDRRRWIAEGVTYPVDVQTPADTAALRSPGAQAAGWLMGEADGLMAQAPDRGLEAAAVQVAVWRLTGQAADVWQVTSDSALNARADALRRLAEGRTPVTALALQAPAAAVAPGAPAGLVVSGTPGAEVDLRVGAGAGTLTATHVGIGPAGTAAVDLTPTGPGTVTVDAAARGGALIRAAHLAGATAPQDMGMLLPQPLAARASVTVTTPVVAPPAVVPPSAVPVARAKPARLRLGKTGPARVVFAHAIRYTLTVTNRSAVTAQDVVVRDPVPQGTSLGRLPARAQLEGGAVVWHLGDLAPGARVTVHLRLRADVLSARRVRNEARASASNAATVRAHAVTAVVIPRRVAPAHIPVTG